VHAWCARAAIANWIAVVDHDIVDAGTLRLLNPDELSTVGVSAQFRVLAQQSSFWLKLGEA